MKVNLDLDFKTSIAGVGIASVAFGCSIFSLNLSLYESVTLKIESLNLWIFTLGMISSILIIFTGAMALCSAKRSSTGLLMMLLVMSTLSMMFVLFATGLQCYAAVWYKMNTLAVNTLTYGALVLQAISSSLSFVLCLASICMTCEAGGGCGNDNTVHPLSDSEEI